MPGLGWERLACHYDDRLLKDDAVGNPAPAREVPGGVTYLQACSAVF
jgi:hypothetical protein